MDSPFAIHVDANEVSTLPPETARLDLKARSLRNTLGILRRRLRDLRRDAAHTLEDVQHYKYVLSHLDQRWRDEEGAFAGALAASDPALAASCSALWTECYDLACGMEGEALGMPPGMQAVHGRLADLHRRLRDLRGREHGGGEVAALGQALQEIEAARRERGGTFWGDEEAPAPGQAICNELLSLNFELLRECAAAAHDVPPELRAVEDRLRRIYNDLRRLAGQRHHTSEDVRHYSYLLGAIASAEAEYQREWEGQEVTKLLGRCLEMVQELQATAEDMPPAVAEVHSQLQLLRKELQAAASTAGPAVEGQVERLLRALDSIDNERAAHGGVFGAAAADQDGAAPPGQAVCVHLLEECYNLAHELKERQAPAPAQPA